MYFIQYAMPSAHIITYIYTYIIFLDIFYYFRFLYIPPFQRNRSDFSLFPFIIDKKSFTYKYIFFSISMLRPDKTYIRISYTLKKCINNDPISFLQNCKNALLQQ